MPGPNNVYKPKMTGFLIAFIALIMVMIVILISTILILSADNENAPAATTTEKIFYTVPTTTGNQTPNDQNPGNNQNPGDNQNPAGTTAPNPQQTTAPNTSGDTPSVNPSDVNVLSFTAAEIGQGPLVLIDKNHFYTRDGLVNKSEMTNTLASVLGFKAVGSNHQHFNVPRNDFYLEANTLDAFKKMMADLFDRTGDNFVQIRNAYYYNAALTAITDQDSLEAVEHSTGCVVDLQIYDGGASPLNHPTYKARFYDWLIENCWKYGFIHLRDVGNKYSTFRYVGIPHAAALHANSSLSFETYLTSLTAYTFENRKKVNDSEGNEWWIYYEEAEKGEEAVLVRVLGKSDYYIISGDNKGGFIVAINSTQFAK